jgi:diguanylate cyclase (GGDEF)-like protein
VLDGITSPVMLLAYAVVVPFLVFVFIMAGDLRREIPAAQSERLGLAQVGLLDRLMIDSARVRASRACAEPSASAAIERDIDAIDAMQAERPFAVSEWQAASAASREGPAASRPSAVIANLVQAVRITADESKLTYDPEVRGIDIADALTYRLPGAFDVLRRAQATLCDPRGLSPAERFTLEQDVGALRVVLPDSSSDIMEAIDMDAPLAKSLAAAQKRVDESTEDALRAVDRAVNDTSPSARIGAMRRTDEAADNLERLMALLEPSLRTLVEQRLVALQRRLALTLAPSIVAILAGVLVSVLGLRAKMQSVEMAKLRAHQLELRHQATHDPLTALPNRAAFFARLDESLESASREGTCVGLLFIDLDNFKSVNDGYGHAAGDEVLRTTSQRLLSICAAAGGRMTARLGGDEFAMLLVGGEIEFVRACIGRVSDGIRLDLTRPLAVEHFEDAVVNISASVGAAVYDGSCGTSPVASDMLREADTAMYHAKAEKRRSEATRERIA